MALRRVSPARRLRIEMIFFIGDESSSYKTLNITVAMIDDSGVLFRVAGPLAHCAKAGSRVGFLCRTREIVRRLFS